MYVIERLWIDDVYRKIITLKFEITSNLPQIGAETIFGETYKSVEKYKDDEFYDDPPIVKMKGYCEAAEYYKVGLYDKDEGIDKGFLYLALVRKEKKTKHKKALDK